MMAKHVWLLPLGLVFLAACSPGPAPVASPAGPDVPAASPTAAAANQTASPEAIASPDIPTVPPAATNVRVPDPRHYEFDQRLPFDAIRPVYEPHFVSAAEAPLVDEELVMGVALGGEAKAYPVTVLRFREMVNDELAGLPLLVTW